MEKSPRIFGLDLIRAVAIGLVVLSHATLFFRAQPMFFGVGLLAGYLGVELFFVLSGFLIGGILFRAAQEDSPALSLVGNFWLRRWFRTLPNYFLFLALNLAIALCYARDLPSLWPYSFFLQNLAAPPAPFFVESWSLAVEEWFYLLLPLLFLARPRRAQLPVIVISILAVTAARFVYVAATEANWLTDVRMIVIFRLDACMFGVAGAWCKCYCPRLWRNAGRLFSVGLLTLAVVVVAPFALAADSIFMRTVGFSFTSLGALFLLPFLDQWKSADGFVSAVVSRVSLWAYALYLVNYPIFFLLKRHAATSPILLACLFGAISLCLAAFVYRFYEQPLMRLRERFVFRRRSRSLFSIRAAEELSVG